MRQILFHNQLGEQAEPYPASIAWMNGC